MAQGLFRDLLEGKKYPTDLIIVIIFAVVALVGTLTLPDGNVVRIILGIPLILFLPGYTIVSALWPERYNKKGVIPEEKKNENEDILSPSSGIDNLERVILSLGLSIAVISLIGIGLNYLWDISFEPILISIFGFVLVMSVLAWYRRNVLTEDERYYFSFILDVKPSVKEWTQAEKFIAGIIGVVLIISVCFLCFLVMLTPTADERYTNLNLLDQNYTIENFPSNLSVNETGTVIVVTTCYEQETTNYITVLNVLNITGERQNSTLWINNFTLDQGETNNITYSFQVNESGLYLLKFELYKEGNQSSYIDCHLWIKVE